MWSNTVKMQNLELFFLKRYIKSPKRNLFRFSFVFMVLGIVLSVGILSAGLHLFQGYESTLKRLLLDSFAHISIASSDSNLLSVEQIDQIRKITEQIDEVQSSVATLQFSLMAQNQDKIRAANLRAYDAHDDAPYSQYISKGKTQINRGEVIVGHYLLEELGLSIGDTLSLNYPRLDRISPLGIPSAHYNYVIAAVYRSGYYENDRSIVISSEEDARDLMMLPSGYSKVELRLKDADQASELAQYLINHLGVDYIAIPWNLYAESLLRLVAMEKWLIFIVFSFLVLIAGINVISTVSTIIIDKKAEIAVLQTLGAGIGSIRRLFSFRVGLVAVLSVIVGQMFGVFLSWCVEKQSFYRLKGDVYFIDTLGAQITFVNLLVIFVVATILIFICILIPLKQIERLQIIDIIRNKN
ncbi:MAG: FtsX-like permease family protein [Candidatus Cloacimonadaceae bacterium]|nr:ABC transporter permease [Candidatus Cloacimonadota bacterium]